MTFAKFQGNWFKIDREIAKIMLSWLIIFNLKASINGTIGQVCHSVNEAVILV